MSPADDPSHGYDAAAEAFMAARSATIGTGVLRAWAATLPPGAAVLDLGCGHGVPVTRLLLAAGCAVHAVDASPTLVAAFRARFPGVPVECATAEESASLERPFDAVIAWGLLFLLPPDGQAHVVSRVAAALRRGGEFLFTAPARAVEWPDALTGRPSISLGAEAYRTLLAGAGMTVEREGDDEGGNHYFLCRRTGTGGG